MTRTRRTYRTNRYQTAILVFLTLAAAMTLLGFSVGLNARADSETAGREIQYVTSVTIVEGDTLWTIAENHHSDRYASTADYVEAIRKANGLSSDMISEGMSLIVPCTVPASGKAG